MKQWKALYVSSRREKKVVQKLSSLGLDAYVPLKKEKRQWSDRKKTVVVPLINGYVFVHVNLAERDIVFRAEGVIQYVRFNDGDAVIRDSEIIALKLIEERGYFTETTTIESITPGTQTIIKYGPFKGLQGIVEKRLQHNQYLIQIEGIGFALKVNVPIEVLQKH